jgi:hypothetical protein
MDVKHVVMFSGGIGSWAAAKRVASKHGTENLYLLFTDVRGNSDSEHVGEDLDTYRFIQDAAENVGGKLVTLNDGRTIWDVFKDTRFLGNSRLAPCSHHLKQKPAKRWIEENTNPNDSVIYVGIDWSESHRLPAIERNYKPWIAKAPLTEPPYLEKQQMIDEATRQGLKPPRLYQMGFSHNNCGGGCVRAGQAQFKHLLDVMPDRYAVWESKEKEMQEFLDRPVSILSEVIDGKKIPLPLTVLRQRAEMQPALIDRLDVGGCGCFVDYEGQDETP